MSCRPSVLSASGCVGDGGVLDERHEGGCSVKLVEELVDEGGGGFVVFGCRWVGGVGGEAERLCGGGALVVFQVGEGLAYLMGGEDLSGLAAGCEFEVVALFDAGDGW